MFDGLMWLYENLGQDWCVLPNCTLIIKVEWQISLALLYIIIKFIMKGNQNVYTTIKGTKRVDKRFPSSMLWIKSKYDAFKLFAFSS